MTQETDGQVAATIDLLAARWEGAGPLLPCFPLLAQGEPLSIKRMAEGTGVDARLIEQALQTVRCGCDENGRLTDLFGMTLAPTYHRLQIEGRVVFSCCALWAHVIPKLVEGMADVESVDPVSRGVVRLSISPDGVESIDPPEAMATLAVADSRAVNADVGAAFCRHVRHFASRHSAERFAQSSPSRHLVTLEELQKAAEQLHHAIWARLRD